jgi:protein SCO1
MTFSPIFLSSAYAVAGFVEVAEDHAGHGYGHLPPSPDALGGTLSFTDWHGKPVTEADFKGHWTLLYFGYSRCTSSCTMALPLIVETVQELRKRKVAVNAAFVDIEAPPLGMVRRGGQSNHSAHAGHGDAGHMNQQQAMRAVAQRYGNDLMVLTGSRAQLAQASAAFRVAREHVPPRGEEQGHSINHSTMIYFVAPDTKVAGYGYHDADAATLADTVEKLSTSPSHIHAETSEPEAHETAGDRAADASGKAVHDHGVNDPVAVTAPPPPSPAASRSSMISAPIL